MKATEMIAWLSRLVEEQGDKKVVNAAGGEFTHIDTDPTWPDEIVIE